MASNTLPAIVTNFRTREELDKAQMNAWLHTRAAGSPEELFTAFKTAVHLIINGTYNTEYEG